MRIETWREIERVCVREGGRRVRGFVDMLGSPTTAPTAAAAVAIVASGSWVSWVS